MSILNNDYNYYYGLLFYCNLVLNEYVFQPAVKNKKQVLFDITLDNFILKIQQIMLLSKKNKKTAKK